jgi:hypothetical protein
MSWTLFWQIIVFMVIGTIVVAVLVSAFRNSK